VASGKTTMADRRGSDRAGGHVAGIDVSTPVVVFRAESYCALGVIRSLGRMGVPVYGIDSTDDAYGLRSRYCAGRFRWDFEHASPDESLEFLRDVSRRVGAKPILLPTFDSRNVFLAERGPDLADSFVFAAQPPGLVVRLYNKRSMYELCRELGIPTAETLFPENARDVVRFLDRVRFPLVLKAVDGDRLMHRTGVRLHIAKDRDDLLSAFERLDEPGHPNLMLQEYIPGEDDTIWMFNGYFDRNSECRFGITGRKLRQNPVHTGMTSLGICLPSDSVDSSTRRLAAATGYRGIMDIGYRYDARDGQYKLLDINPRIGATFRLFVDRNGMDVVRALYLDLTGQAVPEAEPAWGRKWFVEDLDVVSSWRYRQEGTLGLLAWLKSYRGVAEAAHFALDDLAPSLAFARRFLVRVSGGALRTAGRAIGLSQPKTQEPPSRLGGSPALPQA
jgi:D-aspartate ligase